MQAADIFFMEVHIVHFYPQIFLLSPASIFYLMRPSTQPIVTLQVDVCQLGVDQRKVNMLAREYRNKNKNKVKNPVILSHHMLLGLKKVRMGNLEE